MSASSPLHVWSAGSRSTFAPAGPRRVTVSIRTFLTLLQIEIRRSQGYWLLPVMIGLGIYAPSIDQFPEIVLWPEMSMATLESSSIVAPLVAAFAAWLVDRDRRRRLRNLIESTPGTGFQRDLLALGTASFWGLAGYAGVAAWFCGQAVLRATWGGPNLALISTGALAVMVFASIGVLVGRLVPSKFSPILALGFTFALTVGSDAVAIEMADGSRQSPARFLLPYGLANFSGENVFHVHRQLAVLTTDETLWMLAVFAFLVTALMVLRQRTAVTLTGLVIALGLAVVAALPLAGTVVNWQPDSYAQTAYTPVCEERAGFEVCVHPAYRVKIDETADRIANLFAPVQGLAGVPDRWEQLDPRRVRTGEEYGAIQDVGYPYALLGSVASIFPGSNGNQHGQHPASQLVIMEWLVQQSNLCIGVEGWNGWFGWPAELDVQPRDFGNGVSGIAPGDGDVTAMQPRLDAALARFSALDPGAQRAWLKANWAALRAGDLTLEDLP